MKRFAPKILALSLVFSVITAAVGHDGAEGIVRERMDLMQSVNRSMKSIRDMVRGKTQTDMAKIAAAARSISNQAEFLPFMFPTDQNRKFSRSSPKIWKDPEGFRASAGNLVKAAKSVEAAAQENNEARIKAAFRSLTKACGSCHKQYRLSKRHNN